VLSFAQKKKGADMIQIPDEKQIRQWIAENRLDLFYGSRAWQQVAEQARVLQHNECQRCRARGYYSPCQIVHHKKYLRARPDLAFDLSNLECLCLDCHNDEHMGAETARGYQNTERW